MELPEEGEEGKFESEAGEDLMKIAEEGCKFAKTYTIKSACTGKFLYLIRDEDEKVAEFCVEDLTDEAAVEKLSKLPKESVIPI
jgi:hypothetical protein